MKYKLSVSNEEYNKPIEVADQSIRTIKTIKIVIIDCGFAIIFRKKMGGKNNSIK